MLEQMSSIHKCIGLIFVWNVSTVIYSDFACKSNCTYRKNIYGYGKSIYLFLESIILYLSG